MQSDAHIEYRALSDGTVVRMMRGGVAMFADVYFARWEIDGVRFGTEYHMVDGLDSAVVFDMMAEDLEVVVRGIKAYRRGSS